MKYDEKDGGTVTLSSGRVLQVEAGCFSRSPFTDDDRIFEGYDGEVRDDSVKLTPPIVRFTAEERREIAEAMVLAWSKWGGIDG